MSERLALPSHFNFVNESPGSVSPFFVVSHCCWVPTDGVVASDFAHARVLMQLPSYNSPETILVHHPTIFHHGTNHLPFFSIHLSRPLQNITSIYQNHDFVYCKIFYWIILLPDCNDNSSGWFGEYVYLAITCGQSQDSYNVSPTEPRLGGETASNHRSRSVLFSHVKTYSTWRPEWFSKRVSIIAFRPANGDSSEADSRARRFLLHASMTV